jgi:hypothetical protein
MHTTRFYCKDSGLGRGVSGLEVCRHGLIKTPPLSRLSGNEKALKPAELDNFTFGQFYLWTILPLDNFTFGQFYHSNWYKSFTYLFEIRKEVFYFSTYICAEKRGCYDARLLCEKDEPSCKDVPCLVILCTSCPQPSIHAIHGACVQGYISS